MAGEKESDLESLLSRGERAAFHGRPSEAIDSLERAIVVATDADRHAEISAARWLLGVSMAAAGRYGTALAALLPLRDLKGQAVEARLFGSLAASTIASIHRQLGNHDVAESFDRQALDLADSSTEARFDALIGLAVDHVGRGKPDEALTFADQAAELAEAHTQWWRQRVRLGWVRAEIAVAHHDATGAASAATEAIALAEASGAPRHVAKGLLFLGVSQVMADDHERAATTLRRAAVLANRLGALPLLWTSRAMLGALLESDRKPDQEPDRESKEAFEALASARTVVLQIAEDLPTELAEQWLARDDIAVLLDTDTAMSSAGATKG
jgi:tetratricopeptide (TPR) repeat protein